MPAISFQEMWLDDLLSGRKQQTTRPQTDRFKVGNIAQLYIEQRRRIIDKPLRHMTVAGSGMVYDRGYPLLKGLGHHTTEYHAHFLGKVEITEVYDMIPYGNPIRSIWAKEDGFDDFTAANTWFTKQYGDDWMLRTWTVVRWNGWVERYFLADQHEKKQSN